MPEKPANEELHLSWASTVLHFVLFSFILWWSTLKSELDHKPNSLILLFKMVWILVSTFNNDLLYLYFERFDIEIRPGSTFGL